MPKGIHEVIALIEAPQITPAYMFALLLAGSLGTNILALIVAIIFSVGMQLASLLFYIRTMDTDLFISDRKKRAPLFAVAIISYAIGVVILYFINAPFIVTALMISYVINTIVASTINHFDKVSIHTWSISGPAVALFYQYGIVVFACAIAVAFLVGYSRVRAKAHSIRQVLLAVAVSVPLTIFVVYILAPAII